MSKVDLTESIFIVDSFLPPSDCQAIIDRSEAIGFKAQALPRSKSLSSLDQLHQEEAVLLDDPDMAADCWQNLKPYIPVKGRISEPVRLYEQFHVYRYLAGMESFLKKSKRITPSKDEFSQWTLVIYLNDDFIGGLTHFTNISIKPRVGMALCFKSNQSHQVSKLIKGTMYSLQTEVISKQLVAVF